jgi:hypothetical protein
MRKSTRKKAAQAHDPSLLEMAIVGYESTKEAIDQKIAEIKKMIGSGGRAISAAVETFTAAAPKKRRELSAKARKSISMAQKRRWEAKRKADAPKPKRKTVSAPKSKATSKAALAKAAEAPS